MQTYTLTTEVRKLILTAASIPFNETKNGIFYSTTELHNCSDQELMNFIQGEE